jgi:hypothetical protein
VLAPDHLDPEESRQNPLNEHDEDAVKARGMERVGMKERIRRPPLPGDNLPVIEPGIALRAD